MAANCRSLLNAYDLQQERPLDLSTHPEIAEELFKPGFRRMNRKNSRVEKRRRNRNQRDVDEFNEVSAATKTKR